MRFESANSYKRNSYFIKRDSCPSCKSQRNKVLCQAGYTENPIKEYLDSFYSSQGRIEFEYLEGGQYILIECDACGMIYQNEIPNEFLMFKLYEEWIAPDKVFDKVEKNRSIKYYIRIVKEVANLISFYSKSPSEMIILDYGMGWGHWARIAKGFGFDVYGLELSKARIHFAETAGINIIGWEEIAQKKFDFINADQVFEHLSQPFETLLYLKQSLKTNGLLKISVPNGTDIKRRLRVWNWTIDREHRNSLNPVAPLEHINCFNYDVLCTMAQKVGLRQIQLPDRFPFLLVKDKIVSISRPFYYFLMSRKYLRHTNIFFIKNLRE